MLLKQWELTKQGNVVLTWCALPNSYFENNNMKDFSHIGDQENIKELIDEVHKRKIDLSDEVLVINVDDYIGDSTKSEVCYAIEHDIPVKWMYPHKES